MFARLTTLLFVSITICGAQTTQWTPPPQVNWQWQLTKSVDTTVDADVYDIDLFDNDESVIAGLHSQGRKAICYVSVGTWEPFRPDAGSFPETVKGKSVSGFDDEKWLDIRRLDVLGPIMLARLDLCKRKGFDAVEPDNVDGYTNKTGFTLTADDQLKYNRYIAAAAHARGLSVGLKNDVDQLRDLVGDFDWALNEQCYEYNECAGYSVFTQARKAVLHVEYNLNTSQFCSKANDANFNSLRKRLALDAFREPCRTVMVAPSVASVRNAGSYAAAGVSASEIVVLFGSGLGPAALAQAPTVDWPTTLGGVRVLFDATPAQLLYVSAGQISAVVPANVQGKASVQVVVDRGAGGVSGPMTMPVVAAVPGLFTLDGSGTGLAAAVNQDGTVNGTGNPARKGSIVSLYATGATSDVRVRIGGLQAQVQYAGGVSWSGPGLMQINAVVPSASGSGAVPVVLESAGVTSVEGVTLVVAP